MADLKAKTIQARFSWRGGLCYVYVQCECGRQMTLFAGQARTCLQCRRNLVPKHPMVDVVVTEVDRALAGFWPPNGADDPRPTEAKDVLGSVKASKQVAESWPLTESDKVGNVLPNGVGTKTVAEPGIGGSGRVTLKQIAMLFSFFVGGSILVAVIAILSGGAS